MNKDGMMSWTWQPLGRTQTTNTPVVLRFVLFITNILLYSVLYIIDIKSVALTGSHIEL